MIPLNKIQPNKYTRGGEFYISSTGKDYQGYYCIVLDTKYYTGKTYDSNSQELIKRTTSKSLLSYTGLPFQNTPIRYFIKSLNNSIIKEVDFQTYSLAISDVLYQTISLNSDFIFLGSVILDQADKQMPGLKTWLLG